MSKSYITYLAYFCLFFCNAWLFDYLHVSDTLKFLAAINLHGQMGDSMTYILSNRTLVLELSCNLILELLVLLLP